MSLMEGINYKHGKQTRDLSPQSVWSAPKNKLADTVLHTRSTNSSAYSQQKTAAIQTIYTHTVDSSPNRRHTDKGKRDKGDKNTEYKDEFTNLGLVSRAYCSVSVTWTEV